MRGTRGPRDLLVPRSLNEGTPPSFPRPNSLLKKHAPLPPWAGPWAGPRGSRSAGRSAAPPTVLGVAPTTPSRRPPAASVTALSPPLILNSVMGYQSSNGDHPARGVGAARASRRGRRSPRARASRRTPPRRLCSPLFLNGKGESPLILNGRANPAVAGCCRLLPNFGPHAPKDAHPPYTQHGGWLGGQTSEPRPAIRDVRGLAHGLAHGAFRSQPFEIPESYTNNEITGKCLGTVQNLKLTLLVEFFAMKIVFSFHAARTSSRRYPWPSQLLTLPSHA